MQHGKGTFATDVMTLAAGTASAHAIGLIAMPILARLYSPADFGALAVFAAIVGPITMISTFRYDLAILLPETDEDALRVAWLCAVLLLGTTLLTTAAVLLAGPRMWQWLHVPTLRSFGWLIPVNVFISGVSTILTAWSTRTKHFKRLMTQQVVTRVVMTIAQLALAVAGFASGGTLMMTAVLGVLAATIVLGVQIWIGNRGVPRTSVSARELISAARTYYRFPRFNLPATALNTVSSYLPTALLSAFFSIPIAGQFSLSTRILRLPSALIGTNLGKAFFPRAAEAKESGTLGQRVEVALSSLVKLTAFPCFLLALIGKDLCIVFLGSRWSEAGVYTQMLSLWLLVWFISSPLYTVFVVLQEQALELRFQIMNLITRLAALLIGGWMHNARVAVGLFALAGVVIYGTYSAAVISKAHARASVVFRPVLPTLAAVLPTAVLIEIVRYLTNSRIAVLVLSAILLGVWSLNLVRTEPAAREIVLKAKHRLFPSSVPSVLGS